MVFTVSSNEHTVKVILNSRNPTDHTTPFNPKFNLRVPVSCPSNMVSMVCLESATILAPSMFGPQLLSDSTNVLQRRIYQAGVQQGVPQDYWGAKNDVANLQGTNGGSNYDAQTNLRTVKSIFSGCTNLDMNDPDNVARFLIDFVLYTRAFKITISALSGDAFTDTTIYWSVTVPQGADNSGFVAATPASMSPVTVANLSAKLKQMGLYTFTLQPVATLNYTAATLDYTTEFRMAGKWLKLFGLNPGMNNADGTTDMYTSCKVNAPTPNLTLQVHGYDNVNIHSSIAKSVYASINALNQNYISPTNILWSIQIVSEPFERTYFSNTNTGGKVSYYMPTMEDIEVYFSDDWGDIITDVFDFQMMLTFDFTLPEPFPEPDTIKRARLRHQT